MIKKRMLIFGLIICSTVLFGQTQNEMNNDAKDTYEKADKKLNQVYQKVLTEYKEDTLFIRKLKAAQRFWVQFRDAEVNSIYSAKNEDKKVEYGSVFYMCWFSELTALTNERIKQLESWSKGIEEGDVCSGSRKLKQH